MGDREPRGSDAAAEPALRIADEVDVDWALRRLRSPAAHEQPGSSEVPVSASGQSSPEGGRSLDERLGRLLHVLGNGAARPSPAPAREWPAADLPAQMAALRAAIDDLAARQRRIEARLDEIHARIVAAPSVAAAPGVVAVGATRER